MYMPGFELHKELRPFDVAAETLGLKKLRVVGELPPSFVMQSTTGSERISIAADANEPQDKRRLACLERARNWGCRSLYR
jgi:hypothetical protein